MGALWQRVLRTGQESERMSRLLVISHTPHYPLGNGSIAGWGPTVRELDYLAEGFGELEHLAPLYKEPAPRSAISYKNPHVSFTPLTPSGGRGIRQKLGIIWNYPSYLLAIRKAVSQADVIQVRCPCNIGIAALFYLTANKNTPRWAKYAGNWVQEHPPLSYRFQKWWLAQGLHGGPVTINGQWPEQPGHVFSFHNPCLTLSEVRAARKLAEKKCLQEPIRLIFVGNVNEAKGVDRALEVIAGLQEKGIQCRFDIIGDGPARKNFEQKALKLQIQKNTHFHGWMQRNALSTFYSEAHFLILPSASEGFPKVISEAMAHGAVPIAGAVSSIPQILIETGAGIALPPEDKDAFVRALQNFVQEPVKWRNALEAGINASASFTYEHYLFELDKMFRKAWGTSPMKIKESTLSLA